MVEVLGTRTAAGMYRLLYRLYRPRYLMVGTPQTRAVAGLYRLYRPYRPFLMTQAKMCPLGRPRETPQGKGIGGELLF